MNWRVSALDRFHLVSNSDAHSPAKLGREANLLEIPRPIPPWRRPCAPAGALRERWSSFRRRGSTTTTATGTAGSASLPGEAEALGHSSCVREAIHRHRGAPPGGAAGRPAGGLCAAPGPGWERLAPLPEVLSATLGGGPDCKRNRLRYEELLEKLGPEFRILREVPVEDIAAAAGSCAAEGVPGRLRAGEAQWRPGYDGTYGEMTLLTERERERLSGQVSLFRAATPPGGNGGGLPRPPLRWSVRSRGRSPRRRLRHRPLNWTRSSVRRRRPRSGRWP